MDDPEIDLRKICCTCLSRDRKLYQLCKLHDGVNNLYLLLSYDSEAYKEGFYKDLASLFVCWECRAVIRRLTAFRRQACVAQKQLSCIADGKINTHSYKLLSNLTTFYKSTYDLTVKSSTPDSEFDNFIDCDAVDGIKTEDEVFDDQNVNVFGGHSCIPVYQNDESDLDIPLSELHISESENRRITKANKKTKKLKKIVKIKKKNLKNSETNESFYNTFVMSERDMLVSRERRKMGVAFADATSKCESCIEGFKNQIELEEHKLLMHNEKPNHLQCDICLSYVEGPCLSEHRKAHYFKYCCKFCDYVGFNLSDVQRHMKAGHSMRNLTMEKKKGSRETPRVLNPGSKPRRNAAMLDKRTPYGYQCTECNKYFENKNQRWKHVQRHHREGFRCQTCGKRFAFKSNLTRHEQLHDGPLPREECPTCNKMIRIDLMKIHVRIHTPRETYSCVACDKSFVSRASYHHHLKYTQAHAAVDILKYKCGMCEKGYRSRGELRDHENYQHRGETQHKCPVCEKALATRRCITRHVRRAHHGIKESARDKICQQCGKAFRDKKGLREHELIHTGERPLSCEVCGGTFRQSASLYTHKRRVHKIHAPRRHATLVPEVS